MLKMTSHSSDTLGAHEVQVYLGSIAAMQVKAPKWMRGLSKKEQARAQAFLHNEDRQRFLLGRHMLRSLLHKYLGIDFNSQDFAYSPYGKPSLPHERAEQVAFNLAHAGQQVVVALARFPVGIYIELVHPVEDLVGSDQVFSPKEQQYFDKGHPEMHRAHFFELWTIKEAYLKAIGTGLSLPMHDLEVKKQGAVYEVVHWRGHSLEHTPYNWHIRKLKGCGEGYVGAVATPSFCRKVLMNVFE